MAKFQQLSARRVETLKKPGKYCDGLGLWLYVRKAGAKSWVFRYMRHGKSREMGLGPFHTLSLAEAREKAAEARKQLLNGEDPIEKKRQVLRKLKYKDPANPTFKKSAERFIETHKTGWKNKKHINQWSNTLETYAYPCFGDLPVQDIDTGLVLEALEPIWTTKPETASRVRGRIERVLDWARARGYRDGENPARWRGHLENLLAAPSKVKQVKHHSALAYEEIPAFMKALRGQNGISPRALEFTILTAARSGEVRKAEWCEIDPEKKIWTIPKQRMKAGQKHRVPLSEKALEILEEMQKHSREGLIFPGAKRGRPLSNMSLSAVLRRMERDGITVHGFRSTFRDWTAEQTAYPREVAEQALAHTLSNKVEAAYRRGDLLEKRRRLMTDWAGYCERKPGPAKVVPISKVKN